MQIPEFHPEARKYLSISSPKNQKKANNVGTPQYNVGNTQKSILYLADKEMPNTQCTVNDTTMLLL